MKFHPNEIKRLADLDFSKFNDKKVQDAYLADDGTNKITKINEAIPDEFHIDFDLSTDMKLNTAASQNR